MSQTDRLVNASHVKYRRTYLIPWTMLRTPFARWHPCSGTEKPREISSVLQADLIGDVFQRTHREEQQPFGFKQPPLDDHVLHPLPKDGFSRQFR